MLSVLLYCAQIKNFYVFNPDTIIVVPNAMQDTYWYGEKLTP